MPIATNKEALFWDIRESYTADWVAEKSRDDVYKRLWGEFLWFVIRAMLIGTLFALVYYHWYITGVDKPPVEIQTTKYVRIMYILRQLPATGAHKDSD